ncbi:TlpA disulfide reductase family protein [Chitinophaga filiformis]|uniref:AhpC/TSA family protein n=1 Tax=Chitinophaga filiformis TaxID=104663 RepID=A0ABY4I214_CHIFI|nr:TlpA disulfide reductase family protein [Chitinophaga filiformis]UPK70128.1 AhpC/TSA family protein [Chitinophaga filiformis]
MKKFALWAVAGLFLASCSQQTEKGDFVINAHIDNAPLGKIYLEELTLEEAKIVDTAVIKDASGKFTLKGMLPEQALYRIRFADNNRFILLGLDAGTMSIEGDYNHLEQVKIENSEASSEIQQLLNEASSKNIALTTEMKTLDSLYQAKTPDSVMKPRVAAFEAKRNDLEQFILKAAKDTKSPAVAAFALSMVSTPTLLQDQKVINELKTRFPENTLIASFTEKLNEVSKKSAAPATDAMAGEDENMTAVKIGQVAPDFTLPDLSGKATSLSSFRGKYVLVDFWASWCKPCRMENPNVVQAYNTYKNKNFTILGVSLDRTKEAWAKAIQADGLTWSHVSDLKFWESAVVPLYGLNSIPSNMLLDPEGKVIAVGLRGPDLQAKLQEVLK